ncbi:hypothetical protein bwei_5364 [Bacillus mycoides]|nr:hypothetical protein bwei_5364 [Bacillus mycoides]EEL03181.1 hypothetical protein bcere0014_52440 [Bacillus cereus BDRD-ST196]
MDLFPYIFRDKKNFLVKMNGDMKDEEFNKYKEVMDKVVK